jgi:hypothetical protein
VGGAECRLGESVRKDCGAGVVKGESVILFVAWPFGDDVPWVGASDLELQYGTRKVTLILFATRHYQPMGSGVILANIA